MGFQYKNLFTRRVLAMLAVVVVGGLIFSSYTIYNLVINTEKTMSSYIPQGHYPKYPKLNLKNKTRQQIAEIMRGEYLVKVGDCIACHTTPAKGSKAFSGGLAFQTPFGVLYSPNITPDNQRMAF